MMLLSRMLAEKTNKWANIVTHIISMLVLATTIPSIDIDDAFHMVIEVAAILWIFRIAWKLPTLNKTETYI